MDYIITEMHPDDWEQVRQIYLESIACDRAAEL